ncbi:MAG: multidrug efflux SMR transporter [Anaerolineae bacterium]
MDYVYLIIAIVSEVIGTAALKASDGFTQLIPSLVVVAGYGLSFYSFSLVLRTVPMGVAYAIWSGLGIVLITLIGLVLYRQVPDWPAVAGMGLIIAGIVVINLLSQTAVP